MSPEYAMQGQFSVKSDVFSFRVLLLEIVRGQKNSSFYLTDSSHDLLSYVSMHLNRLMYTQLFVSSSSHSTKRSSLLVVLLSVWISGTEGLETVD